MQPVLPRTMVRGPAAFTIIFITSADSHPWQVRWPEVKYSSRGSFFMLLKGSSCWVSSIVMKEDIGNTSSANSQNLKTSSRPLPALFAQTDPLRQRELFSFRRLIKNPAHLFHIRHGDFASAQA